MSAETKLYLCMGSACYHHGAAAVLKVIQEKLRDHQLQTRLELMGHFCLGTCDQAVMMKYGKHCFGHLSPENAAEKFETEILPVILRDVPVEI